jgi:DNA-binding MarR family transcriptional regulator
MSPDPRPSATDPVRTASTLARVLGRLKRDADLSLTEAITLLAIAENEGITTSDLARVCGHTIATASRSARGMLGPNDPGALHPFRGLVLMRMGPIDNKRRHLFLTPAGRRLCEHLDTLLDRPISPILMETPPLPHRWLDPAAARAS